MLTKYTSVTNLWSDLENATEETEARTKKSKGIKD
jgi:hypothetical protein